MMRKRQINDSAAGALILLFFLLTMHLLKGISGFSAADSPPCDDKVFVHISGNIQWPGVYAFCQPPVLKELLIRAGGLIPGTQKSLPGNGILCHCGSSIYLRSDGQKAYIFEGEMSAFYKVTLGIPISLNNESLEGLTAVPGIGPTIARAIVRERAKREGFQQMDEMLSIPGIGPTLYRKATRYLTL
ncbi:MAG: helix-hairpin-helix domain-containing protein [Desulfobacterales bacterium]|nr:helix-hairpin-helix domain-containing protein [Pseudomonadota bacterium]MCG2777031.1 helix-hairpin-helix domain-containing protein [Desulfobacterales bacterium]